MQSIPVQKSGQSLFGGAMSGSTATQKKGRRERPLSPHLSVYRLTPTMIMSGMHRITGIALYFGTLLVAWWLIAAAIGKPYFDWVSWLWGTWIGMLVLFGYTWALIHHMIGGIRHFIWDTGAMLDKDVATKFAMFNLVASIGITLLIWIGGFLTRGIGG